MIWQVVVVALALGGGIGSAAAERRAGKSTDSAISAAARGNNPVAVLVHVAPDALDAVAAALHAKGTAVRMRLPDARVLSVVLHPNDVDAVLAMPGVLGLSADAVVQAAGAAKKKTSSLTTTARTSDTITTTSTTTATWSTWFADWSASSQQSAALFGALGTSWTGLSGAGVRVAVIDSGIDGTAPEFADRIADFYDFTTGGRRAPATDDYGHGTHVAGLIGAAGSTFRGVAPKVEFVGLKVLDANGQGRTSDVIAALDFVTQNKRRLGIHIVNLSMGHPIYEPAASDPLVLAVERAVAAGLVVVTSAGNIGQHPETGVTGYAGITSPGNAPSALTVGSLDLRGTADRRDDTVSPFSSRGPTWYDGYAKPDIVAPGHGLFAVAASGSMLAETSTLSASGTAAKLYGTSMAAATASGVVALLLEANRAAFPDAAGALTANGIKAILQYTSLAVADPAAGAEFDALTAGAGGINALGALTLARHLDPDAAIGAWRLRSAVSETSTLAGVTLPWTRRMLWGQSLVYGEAVYTNAPAWQTAVVWGDALVWGDTFIRGDAPVSGDLFVWGENVVTSTSLIWGEAIVWGDDLVSVEGQLFIWGDTYIWGELLVWGELFIWGDSVGCAAPACAP